MSDGTVDEFDCVDCGCAVVLIGFMQTAKLCAGCAFLRQIKDDTRRAEMRALFLERGVIGPIEC